MARKLKSDRVLFTTTVLLVLAGIVMVYSASALVAQERFQQANLFLTRQALWAVLGVALLAITMRVNYRIYRNETFVWSMVGVTTFMLVVVLFMPAVNGSHRWLGFGGLGIQPSELAKLTCVFFAAMMLERRMHRINDLSYSLLPVGIVVAALTCLVILEPDFGTAMALLLIVAVMVFAAGLDYKYFVGSFFALAPAALLSACQRAVPETPSDGVLGSVGGSAG